ncbi:nucleotidyltransferase substrate binding protein [soil metagenome]
MSLDLSSLEMALLQLKQTVDRTEDEEWMSLQDNITRNAMRAGVIQHFEIVFELCWKYIQRWILENQTPNEAVFPRTRKELFRMAARYGLIDNPEPWFAYGDARNITSHTYNSKAADLVYQQALELVISARYLLEQLRVRNA